MRVRWALLGALGWLVSVGIASGWAAGGSSIAGAPTIPFGVQLFGNTGTDGGTGICGNQSASWWQVAGTAGDKITIDFEAPAGVYSVKALRVYPSGTSDYTFTTTDPYATGYLQANNKGELVLELPKTETLPLVFDGDDSSCGLGNTTYSGAYNFEATVLHSVVLGLARQVSIRRNGTVIIQVHDPDGGRIATSTLKVKLEAKLGKKWAVESSTSSVSGGMAKLHLVLPKKFRGRSIVVRAIAGGTNYQASVSRSETLRVS